MSTQTVRPSSGDSAQRRGQAFAGAIAGVAVVVVLAIVFFAVRHDNSDKSPAAAAPATTAPAAAEQAPPSAAPEPTQAAEPTPAQVNTPPALAKEPVVAAGKGTLTKLVVTPLVKGTGPAVRKGQTITTNYTLVGYSTGEVKDSSWSRKQPFSTPIGVGAVIKGWDEGIPGQKVGSRIQIDVPAKDAYGPSEGDLRFVVDILAAQ